MAIGREITRLITGMPSKESLPLLIEAAYVS